MTAIQDFADLSRSVFGEAVDAEALWAEVAKMNPGPSDVHTPGSLVVRRRRRVAKREPLTPEQRKRRREMERKVAQVSNAVGLAAGLGGTQQAVQNYRQVKATGSTGRLTGAVARKLKISNRGAARLGVIGAGSALGLQVGNVAGDVVTARVLGRKEGVDKGLKEMVAGALANTRRLTGYKPPSPPKFKPYKPMTPVGGGLAPTGRTASPIRGTEAQNARWNSRAAAGKAKVGPAKAKLNYAGRHVAPPGPTVRGNDITNKAPALARTYGGGDSAMNRLHQLRQAAATRAAAAAPAPKTPALRYTEAGQKAKGDFNNFIGTTTGKITAGTGGALVLGSALRRDKGGGSDPYAYYGKRDVVDDAVFAGTFSKLDEDKRLAFGWASVVEVNGLPVVDRQGDYIGIDDLEDAAYVYVEKSRVGGSMHRRSGHVEKGEDRPHHVADLVESIVFTPEKIAKMGLPSDFPVGWWVGYRYFDDDAWADIKEGRHTGFSIHGKGIRKNIDFDSLMGAGR